MNDCNLRKTVLYHARLGGLWREPKRSTLCRGMNDCACASSELQLLNGRAGEDYKLEDGVAIYNQRIIAARASRKTYTAKYGAR